jgi:nitroimidazol reductase NimA-like FMN-containing flavoprotein (pyridoxamine 5'-phosphate oxidase superfamily)
VHPRDPADIARAVIDGNHYMTLGTADEEGLPWVSPVWYATADRLEFVWVSSPEARHSRNLAKRPEASIVIFDSRQAPGSADAVYMSALAEELTGAELERGLAIFAAASREQGLSEWTLDDVTPPARHRLYRARAQEQFVLGPQDERIAVSLAQ